ncbi:diguanylate cyclase domain-containing protein [Paraburkholderia terrae]
MNPDSVHHLPRQLISRGQAVLAGCFAALLVVGCLVVLPAANRPIPPEPLIFPIAYTCIFVCSGLTALLLLLRFGSTRKNRVALIGSAYVFLCAIAIFQLAVMLGLLNRIELPGARRAQVSPWLWVFFHGGFPLLLVIARLTVDRTARFTAPLARCMTFAVAIPLLGACALTFIAERYADMLPALMIGNARTPFFDMVMDTLCIEALGALTVEFVAGLRDRLDLWLAVTLIVYVVDDVLTNATAARYTLGWASAAGIAVASSAILLGALLWDVQSLYRALLATNAHLKEQAFYDGLTGVFSRRYFDLAYPQMLRDLVARQEPLGLLLIDVDYFKAYNDQYGHQAGDECLACVARAINTCLSSQGQFVARYGGEEFVAVLPGVTQDRGREIAEKIRRSVEAMAMNPTPGLHQAAGVTVSLGVGWRSALDATVDPATLLRFADEALYAAKQSGRNCVRVSERIHRGRFEN